MSRPALPYYTLCAILLFSCNQGDNRVKNLHEKNISVIGHGGSGFNSWMNTLPINSFESMQQAVEENNVDGIEMDVQLSEDNKLVLYHDELLEKSTDCSGLVNHYSEKALIGCSYSSLFRNTEFQITSLDKIIQHFSGAISPPFLTFDLKLYPSQTTRAGEYVRHFATAVSKMADKYCCHEKILIESTSKEMLLELKSINPQLQLFIYPGDYESGLATAKELCLTGITIRHNLISKAQVEQAHQNGLRVTLWGTKSKNANLQAALKNPDYIQTDDIKSLTSLLH